MSEDTKEVIAMDYEYIKNNMQQLVDQARKKMIYEVPLIIKDMEHYVKVIKYFTETIGSDRKTWGFTSLPVTEIAEKGEAGGSKTSVMIFVEQDGDFDPEAVGMYLSLL